MNVNVTKVKRILFHFKMGTQKSRAWQTSKTPLQQEALKSLLAPTAKLLHKASCLLMSNSEPSGMSSIQLKWLIMIPLTFI